MDSYCDLSQHGEEIAVAKAYASVYDNELFFQESVHSSLKALPISNLDHWVKEFLTEQEQPSTESLPNLANRENEVGHNDSPVILSNVENGTSYSHAISINENSAYVGPVSVTSPVIYSNI